ncbi:transglycosylase SLT domain-containing protein [Parapusillimonas granuli]|uniref:Transglycosylase SLT domain-containing protein n=1 Tax=Parapusillimonas granuli TaxID=380911 RepID=A0A853FU55_9BURK|nr:transglycosylase SLT domain-containing protein [Parapusillimonas granuli]MBB5215157.1 soluble lytic murein transglycosylase-like protein [Parapusillimonas granuli]MEB2401811.1 transglycosylase SLT domain-containing protein [Alcaligenaceae bacterium]NYT49475.1 transglycosylase SLT domain-containing protein [Parapusillimonas granuli]
MVAVDSENLLSRSARSLVSWLGEFVHVCAIYSGIAVLVTAVFGMTVPSLRHQVAQVYDAVVLALRPDGFKQDLLAVYGAAYSDGLFYTDDKTPRPDAGGASPADAAKPAVASIQSFSAALKASIADQHVTGMTSAQFQALRSYIARKYRIAQSVAGAIVNTAFIVGQEKNLDPQLILAVIAIESRYNPYAESHVGAQGLMQVMTNVHRDKFEPFDEGMIAALTPIANIRVGVQILHDCIERRGSLEGGLACYVGATGPGDGGYGARVLAERRRIALASGIPVGR